MNRVIYFLTGLLLLVSWKAEVPDYYQISTEEFASLYQLQQPVDPKQPDYALLDAAIFHATNRSRAAYGLAPLQYGPGLHQTARGFAEDMIQLDFYNHVHPYSPTLGTLSQRIAVNTWEFFKTAENIGQYQVIDTPSTYCCRKKRDGTFEYFDCEGKKIYASHTYETFANYAVNEWLHSAPHRRNMLDSTYTHLGCAARISKNPYLDCRAPFGRFVQNFGRAKAIVSIKK